MTTGRLKSQIQANAAEIVRLNARIGETVALREKSPAARRDWEQACSEFHRRYDELAFPGGYSGALERITAGDEFTIEAALCFLECRPYFFRSGYMFKDILRRLRRAPQTKQQATRLAELEHRLQAWRATRAAT